MFFTVFLFYVYEMRREQYRYGTLSIADLLIAENNMRNAEIELIYAKYSLPV